MTIDKLSPGALVDRLVVNYLLQLKHSAALESLSDEQDAIHEQLRGFVEAGSARDFLAIVNDAHHVRIAISETGLLAATITRLEDAHALTAPLVLKPKDGRVDEDLDLIDPSFEEIPDDRIIEGLEPDELVEMARANTSL